MAPFQYDTPSAPLTGSIADAMLRGGDIRAQLAMQTANINAAAQARTGQMWGNVVSNISQLPQQIAEQRRADATAQSNALYRNMQIAQMGQQLQEHQTATAQQKLFDDTINELAPKYKSTDPATNTPTLDFDGLTTELRKRGLPDHLISDWTGRAMQSLTQVNAYAKQQMAERDRITGELADLTYDSKTPDNYAMGLRAKVQQGKVPATVAQATLQQLNEQSDNYENWAANIRGLAPDVATRRAALAKTQAETEKDLAAAAADRNKTPPRLPPDQEALDSYARALLGPTADGSKLSDAQRQAYDQRNASIASTADFNKFVREQQYKIANPVPADQNKAEQQYRTVLKGAMSNRSGGIGLEDLKVQSANHLLSLFDAAYDPKTGTYNIPPTLQTELAIGLAKLMAPSGNVGIEMVNEVNQRTLRGDLVGAFNHVTGSTATGAPQKVLQMFRDSIRRQGEVAQQNREGEMNYLRGLAPTELEPARREALEKTGLNPLRMSRLAEDGKLYVSIDGGKTWQ